VPGVQLTGSLAAAAAAGAGSRHGLVLGDAGDGKRSMKFMAAVARSDELAALLDELARVLDPPHMDPAEIDQINQAVDIRAPSDRQALEDLLRPDHIGTALSRLSERRRGAGADRTELPAISSEVITFLDEQSIRIQRPVPDPGAPVLLPPGVTAQDAGTSAWLAPRDVAELAQAAIWSGPRWHRTLHVGAPGDAEAELPLLTMQDVSDYARKVPEDSKPVQVMVHRRIGDEQAWAEHLGTKVYEMPGEPDAAGHTWMRDRSGNRYEPLVTWLAFTPRAPGSRGEDQPEFTSLLLDKLVGNGLLKRVRELPTAFMLAAHGDAPAHSVEIAGLTSLIFRPWPLVMDSARRAAYAAVQPEDGVLVHRDPRSFQSQLDRLLAALAIPESLVSEQIMDVGPPPVPR
jgi:hypothetical protein